MPDVDLSFDAQIILDQELYPFIRFRGDLLTRYFGGEASDANFPSPPNGSVSSNLDLGYVDNFPSWALYRFPNDIPTPGAFDKISFALASSIDLSAGTSLGTRAFVDFDLLALGQNHSICLGFFGDAADPWTSIDSGNVAAFAIETEEGQVYWRAFFGTDETGRNEAPLKPIEDLLGHHFVVEIEILQVAASRIAEFRLFDFAESLDTPIAALSIETSDTPVFDRFSVATLGKRLSEYSAEETGTGSIGLYFLDVEPGVGSIFTISPSVGLLLSDAKWRRYPRHQNRCPMALRQFGANDVYVSLSQDAVTGTEEKLASLEIDDSNPEVTVTVYNPQSHITLPGPPTMTKLSRQSGFSIIRLTWYADSAGRWTVRADSTGANSGTELESGEYSASGAYVNVDLDFANYTLSSGAHDITLYVIGENGVPAAKKIGEYINP